MVRTEVIEWLKSIKEKYIHGGDDFYDHQRRTAIYYAVGFLEGQKPMTNADRIRAMSDEELVSILMGVPDYPCDVKIPAGECDEKCEKCIMNWLQQPAEGGTQ